MKTFICEICGDAYLGNEKPSECPFCGANHNFIKDGKEAMPVVEIKETLSDVSIENLKKTLELEMDANAIYICMANSADTYEIKKMYKRLAKVELEHATICVKLLGIEMPVTREKECSLDDVENFRRTLQLEDDASKLYVEFAKTSEEKHIKIMFTAISKVEADHLELIKNYL